MQVGQFQSVGMSLIVFFQNNVLVLLSVFLFVVVLNEFLDKTSFLLYEIFMFPETQMHMNIPCLPIDRNSAVTGPVITVKKQLWV